MRTGVALDLARGQVWSAKPNRDADEIAFEIVGSMRVDGARYWIAAKHLPDKYALLSTLEVSLILVDEEGHSVPSNLTFAPQLEWRLTKRIKKPARYAAN